MLHSISFSEKQSQKVSKRETHRIVTAINTFLKSAQRCNLSLPPLFFLFEYCHRLRRSRDTIGTTSLPPFFVVVWAAQREAPLYSCPSHTLSLDSIPAIDTVSLFRFLSSLILLSPCPPPSHTEQAVTAPPIALLSSAVPYKDERVDTLLPCAFASAPLFSVAVLAGPATGSEKTEPAFRTEGLLRWIAIGLARALAPSPSSHATSDLPRRLHHLWKEAAAATQATAAAMDRYGVHEVLADGSDTAGLRKLISAFQEGEDSENVSPVAAAVRAYLVQWWLPFLATNDAQAPRLQLVGFFVVAGPSPTRPAPSRGEVTQHVFAVHPASETALRCMAAACDSALRHNQLSTKKNTSATPDKQPARLLDVVVARQASSHALLAIDTGGGSCDGARVFQVATVFDVPLLPATTIAVHRVDASNLQQHYSTLWCKALLHSIC